MKPTRRQFLGGVAALAVAPKVVAAPVPPPVPLAIAPVTASASDEELIAYLMAEVDATFAAAFSATVQQMSRNPYEACILIPASAFDVKVVG